jgi:hypothetical protein
MLKKAGSLLIIFLLLATILAVAVFYNSEKSTLKEKIADLEGQVDSLNLQLANISTTVNLVTSLNVTDEINTDYGFHAPIPCVEITGSIYNSGGGVAYHVGLQVLAYNSNGLLMNITIPLSGRYEYHVDENIHNYLDSNQLLYSIDQGWTYSFYGFQTEAVYAYIYHENLFPNSTTYKITPIWTNTPPKWVPP